MRRIFACGLAVLVTACATPAQPDRMVAAAPPASVPDLLQKITIAEVVGGKETNPMLAAEVGNDELREAVRLSLERAGYLSPDAAAAPLRLNVALVALDKPASGFTMSVASIIRYTLSPKDGGPPSFDGTVQAVCTLGVSEEFVGIYRLQKAEECSVQKNIEAFLARLAGGGTAVAAGPATPADAAEGLARAMAAPPAALAQGYLAVAYTLLSIKVAQAGGRVVTSLDGKPETITKDNADAYAKSYGDRLAIYGQAIRSRGFANVGGRYAMSASPACQGIGLADRTVTIEQTGYELKLDTGWGVKNDGVAVENAIVFQHALEPDVSLVGTAAGGAIELRAGACSLTLKPLTAS
jgi:hypothetical protein